MAKTDEVLDISPSDLSQSIVRVVFVSTVVAWSFVSTGSSNLKDAFNSSYFTLSFSYWSISLLVCAWTFGVLRKLPPQSRWVVATRVVGIFADIGAISAYTAISGPYGIILYPVYLTSIIGYGYRFGVRYLYLTLFVSAVFFSLALRRNEYIQNNGTLIWAYYLGIGLVPLYAASLLGKHRAVLRRIREVNDARSRFIANMSHELRTPLHAIISVSDVLREDLASKRQCQYERNERLLMISDSAQHLLNLVNRVLDVASIDAGKLTTTKHNNVNLYEVIHTALRICEPKAQEKGIGFYWYFDSRLPKWTLSSADYLQEIVINTVGNAVKYTNTGHVNVRLRLEEKGISQFISIQIIDTGIGISSKLLPTIFEPFTLGDDGAARRFAGTGLGLTLTKQYVEYLNGEIKFESIEDVGTRCKITLPLIPPSDVIRDNQLNRSLCVLLSPKTEMDDDLEAFRNAGWECRQYENASLALADQPDAKVVFVDREYLEFQDVIVDRLLELSPRALLVLYGGDNTEPTIRVEFNSAVDYRAHTQLLAILDLEGAAFPTDYEVTAADRIAQENPKRILIVDDNVTNLKTARMTLESVGHIVVAVSNGEEALNELDRSQYDLAFVDMHMPGMSGIEVAKIYQFVVEAPRRTPIVILTADATTEAKEAAEDCGAVGFLTKPLRAMELREAVRVHTASSELSTYDAAKNGDDAHSCEFDRSQLCDLWALGINRKDLIDMVAEFCDDSCETISKFETACDKGDVAAVRNYMHTLKGSAATIGARSLHVKAASIEGMSWDALATIYSSKHSELLIELEACRKALLAEIEQLSSEDPLAHL